MDNSQPGLDSEDSVAGDDAPQAAPRPGDSYVRSFARGLSVLRSFGADAPAQTLSEVAERTGLTRAGARRILLTLLNMGYVSSEGRLFRLTPKVLELGFAYLSSLPVWSQAQPVMENLVEELRQSSSVAVLDGNEIVYVLRIPAHRIMSINLGVGSRLPADCTAMGRVLLAGLTDEALHERVESMNLIAHTPATIVDPKLLIKEIEQVRVQGWSLVSEELEPGLVSVAAPIRGQNGKVVAALNISGQASAITSERLLKECLPKLLAAASKINMLTGAH